MFTLSEHFQLVVQVGLVLGEFLGRVLAAVDQRQLVHTQPFVQLCDTLDVALELFAGQLAFVEFAQLVERARRVVQTHAKLSNKEASDAFDLFVQFRLLLWRLYGSGERLLFVCGFVCLNVIVYSYVTTMLRVLCYLVTIEKSRLELTIDLPK